MEETEKNESRPVLGGRKWPGEGPPHGFSKAQMAALAAVCEALIPSLDTGMLSLPKNEKESVINSVHAFMRASGAESPLPDEVVRRLVKGLEESTYLIRAAVWALSTRQGTLALCGTGCMSSKFPFVRRFSKLSIRRREKALQKWNRESFFWPLRLAFVILKIHTFYNFFTRCDENMRNPFWEAISYEISTPERPRSLPRRERPLEKGLVEMKRETDETMIKALTQKGLEAYKDGEAGTITVECDAVIVGSGCGGGVAAAVLAGAGYKVIVIEKGDYFVAEDYTGNEGPSVESLYEAEGIIATLDLNVLVFAGSTVGGGSAVNWSASIPTPAHIMKEWAEAHRLPLFGSLEYLAAVEAVCERIGVTERCEEEGLQNKALRRGCERLGLEVESVARNSPEGHFCGACGYGCPTAEKRGTDTTWLVDAVDHGAVILTGCEATNFLLEKNKRGTGVAAERRRVPQGKRRGKRCVGVAARASSGGGVKKTLRIRAGVSLCSGGSLRTPLLLTASGLKNRHVGKNLHLHPVAMAWGFFPEEEGAEELPGRAFQGGIITSMHKVEPAEGMQPSVIVEAPALGPGTFSTLMPWVSGQDMKERMSKYGRTVHLFAMARDRSTGVVVGDRRITYRMEKSDEEEIQRGLRRALEILVAAGAAEVGTHRSDGQRIKCKGIKDEDLEEFLGGVDAPQRPSSGNPLWGVYCSAHQMGSCRMGASEREGAVDEHGESWEAEGLFVCDASLFPTAIGVNPMITIQSIALCVSRRLVKSLDAGEAAD
ncbi:long-chain-alcohol oxidase FAO2-like [Wolffia australiana]